MTFPRNDFEAWALPHFSGGDAEAVVALAELDSKGEYRSTEMRAARDAWRQMANQLEAARQEARTHAQEARTQRATVHEIYQVASGSTGEPGDWHGAEPVRELVAERDSLQRLADGRAEQRDALAAHVERLHDDFNALVSESYGVAELHANGDVAPWDELARGGRFEQWLLSFSDKPAISLTRRDAEQFRQGFWWGFERARCTPDQTNIRAEFEGVQELRRRNAEQADKAEEAP
ncbi:hypothetical protein [Halomonas koreensis]|uniref:Uncharacterized protein n=1 Tax=Halomonas koreensis TaxID=245385 RepID=A0ABU1G6B7_9GAMM|nr:hypothetical protein [Halomonas koreensis]MDR5867979.1 hypothetical protein [Halomonas koreensis]